jgi:hypothetical protein
MELFQSKQLSFEGQDYEIRVLYEEGLINVAAFRDKHPASGYRYQIKLPKRCDVLGCLERNIMDPLVEMCEKDILERRWEKAVQKME